LPNLTDINLSPLFNYVPSGIETIIVEKAISFPEGYFSGLTSLIKIYIKNYENSLIEIGTSSCAGCNSL
jgi:hypothetical protein